MQNRYGLRAIIVMLLLALGCKVGLAQIGPRYVLELAPPAGAGAAAIRQQERGLLQWLGNGLAMIRFQGLSIMTVSADAGAFSADAVPDWPAADLLIVMPAAAGRYGGLAPLSGLRRMPVIVSELAPDGAAATATTAAAGAATAAAAAELPQFYPMQTWDALHLRKGKTRLRVTALPGPAGTPGVAGFMLEVGNSHASYRLYLSCVALAAEEFAGLAQRLPGADLAVLPGADAPQLMLLQRAGKPALMQPAALSGAGYAFAPVRR